MAAIESDDELKPKSASQVAQRVLALLVTIGKVHDPVNCIAWMKNNNLQQFLTPAELAFIQDKKPSEETRVAFSWRTEALVSLLWALGILPEMPPMNEEFDVFEVEGVRSVLKNPDEFVITARLRKESEISNMESYFYHQHWRVRDAELRGIGRHSKREPSDPPIEELNPGIVYERRYGLSWLVGWGDDWDNVPTDT